MPKFFVDDVAGNEITLRATGNNYRNTFVVTDATGLAAGERVEGTIHAPAWKIDRVEMGGNYVEPLFGRPRRMQGTILSVNASTNELTVKVGYEVTVKLPVKYKASEFLPGQRVGWDNIEIPAFVLAAKPVLAGESPDSFL